MTLAFAADMAEPFFAIKVGHLSCFCMCDVPPRSGGDDLELQGPHSSGRLRKLTGLPLPVPSRVSSELPEAGSRPDEISVGFPLTLPAVQQRSRPWSGGGSGAAASASLVSGALTEEHPAQTAARLGRFLEAQRHLERLEAAGVDPLTVLDGASVERIHRIVGRYDYSKRMLSMSIFDLQVHEVNTELGLQWGLELSGNLLRFIYEIEEDHDIVRGFVGVQERDLHKAFNKGMVSAEQLGHQHPNDGLWRSLTISQSTGMKGDNISMVSSLDALGEPEGQRHIWACNCSLPEGAHEVGGVRLPPTEPGYSRLPYSFWVATLTPLGRHPREPGRGYRMKVVIEVQLPYVASKVVAVMPGMLLRRIARNKMEQAPKDFREFVRGSSQLDERLKSSPRAEFYQHLRHHILALPDSVAPAG